MLQDLVGQTKSSKVLQECVDIYLEKFHKKFPNYFVTNLTKCISLVSITENNEIKKIGMSKVEDLLCDQFGIWFGALVFPTTPINLKDSSGVVQVVNTWTSGGTWNSTGSIGTLIEVGKGATAPTRQDFVIENLLQVLTSGNGGYNSGLGTVDIPATILSNFTDTITETTWNGVWTSNAGVKQFLLSHDLISPSLSVLSGQTINVDYKLLLS